MIILRNLSLSFGPQTIFDGISGIIDHNQRIGLVGRNGAGKSTFLKVLAGEHAVGDGQLSLVKGKRIAYFPQEVVLASDKSVINETMQAFGDSMELKHEADALEPLLGDGDVEILERYAFLMERLAEIDPERMRARAMRVLMGLGFSIAQCEQPVSTLSIGWRMRIVLAKLLLQDADFYLFDEPTNHLDIVAKDWFIDFLKTAPFGFMLVCHERHFLDQLCSHILELELGKGTFYTGNYSSYETLKERKIAALESAHAQQQRDIKRRMETIDRFRAKANTAKLAQSMLKKLDKMEKIEVPPEPPTVRFNFPPPPPSGTVVLKAKNCGYAFGEKQLFSQVSFEIVRGEKVALVAANGVGKSTLFNIIAGTYAQQRGSIAFGHAVACALFDQDQSASFTPDKTVVHTLQEACPRASLATIRMLLGAFLFDSDAIDKPASVLSGGEKNRLGMIKVLLQRANLLLLDEPTNHLDIPSKEVLVRALHEYTGTVFFVSHDHDVINRVATRVIELTPTGVMSYSGNYESYVYQKQHALKSPAQPVALRPQAPRAPQAPPSQDQAKKTKSLESRIEKYETEIEKLELQFSGVAYGTAEFDMLTKKLAELKKQLAAAWQEWEVLAAC